MTNSGLYPDLLQAAAFPLREGPSACQPHPEAHRACLDRVLSVGGPTRTCGLAGAISGGIGQVSVPPPRPFGGATAVRQPGLDVGRAPPAAHLLVQLCGLVPPVVSPTHLLASCCQPLAVLALVPIHLINRGRES